jgi:hypothetical protein
MLVTKVRGCERLFLILRNQIETSGSNVLDVEAPRPFWEYDDRVKRALLIFAMLLFSGVLLAQVRSTVAGSTSSLPGRSAIPSGVPIGGVNSVGPSGFSYSSPCNNGGCSFYYPSSGTTYYGSSYHGTGHGGHGGHGHGGHGNCNNGHGPTPYCTSAYYIPYAYPVAVPVAVEPEPDAPDAYADSEPDAPAPTVFERRPVVQPAPYAAPAHSTASADPNGKHVNLSPVSDEKIPVVVVFKDGHQQEISNGNYAIVGDMLYDLSGPVAHKIKLADVDLAQTVQQNEQRGVEFSVPSSYKPQA